jgi:hypothetical protein
VTAGGAVDIYVDAADFTAVVRAVGDLRADVQKLKSERGEPLKVSLYAIKADVTTLYLIPENKSFEARFTISPPAASDCSPK